MDSWTDTREAMATSREDGPTMGLLPEGPCPWGTRHCQPVDVLTVRHHIASDLPRTDAERWADAVTREVLALESDGWWGE